MAKSVLDDFNEEDKLEPKEDKEEVNWNDSKNEAICAVCDAYFVVTEDRPPIFCPKCKKGLKKLIVE